MTQLIRVNGQRVHGGVTVRIGVQRDNDVRRIVFQSVPTIGDAQTVSLLWMTDKHGAETTAPGDIITLERVEDGYVWDVLGRITQYAGRTIRAYVQVTLPDGREWHTEEFRMSAFALPDIEATASDPTYTSIDQMLAAIAQHNEDMAAALSGAQEAQRAAEAASATTQADAAATAQDRARAEAAAAIAESGLHVVTLSIDEDGYLVQHMAGEGTAITFDVDTDGYLEVQING